MYQQDCPAVNEWKLLPHPCVRTQAFESRLHVCQGEVQLSLAVASSKASSVQVWVLSSPACPTTLQPAMASEATG